MTPSGLYNAVCKLFRLMGCSSRLHCAGQAPNDAGLRVNLHDQLPILAERWKRVTDECHDVLDPGIFL